MLLCLYDIQIVLVMHGCGINILVANCLIPHHQMLVFNREQTVLNEIEAHLTTCGSVEEPLTAFAVEAARSLLSCSVAVEQGQTTPPYGAALAVFSILTYGKEEDSQLCQLAYSMVLHFLRKCSQ